MEEQQSFPYLQLFAIVLASLLVTVILFWVWHMVQMHALQVAHNRQNESVRSDIATLEAYIATTGTTSEKTNDE